MRYHIWHRSTRSYDRQSSLYTIRRLITKELSGNTNTTYNTTYSNFESGTIRLRFSENNQLEAVIIQLNHTEIHEIQENYDDHDDNPYSKRDEDFFADIKFELYSEEFFG